MPGVVRVETYRVLRASRSSIHASRSSPCRVPRKEAERARRPGGDATHGRAAERSPRSASVTAPILRVDTPLTRRPRRERAPLRVDFCTAVWLAWEGDSDVLLGVESIIRARHGRSSVTA